MKPVLQALVLAERVYTEQSGKKIIAGTFNRLLIGKMPVQEIEQPDGTKRQLMHGGTDPGCPWVYISLTDVVDRTKIDLQMVNVSKNEIVFETSLELHERNRLATVEIVVPLPRLGAFVREPGVLSFDVVWNEDILGSHRLTVEEVKPSTEEEQQ